MTTTKPEVTPRITELHVRMDCNGCEHKIRKTLSAIDGVSEVYMDQANHKITVVGIADPERIVKAIRKTKRVPTIRSRTEPAAEAQPPPPPSDAGEAPPPPADLPANAAPPAESEAPPAADPTPENKAEAPPPAADAPATDAIVIIRHTVHEHDNPYGHDDHLFREHWANHPVDDMYGVRYDAAPYHATHHSCSHRRPSPPYIAGYGYVGSPVQEGSSYYSHDYYYPARGKGDGGQITSMFSDENPNACSIS